MIFDPEILTKYRLLYLKLRALSGSSRFFILNIIRVHQPINVSEIIKLSKLDQPIVSQLLSVLRKAEFVKSVAVKKEKHYQLNEEEVQGILEFCTNALTRKESENMLLSDYYTEIQQTYHLLKHLLHPNRMTLLEYLYKTKKSNISQLVEISNLPQSIVSQNMSLLKTLGVIHHSVQGRNSFYELNNNALDHLRISIEKYFSKNGH